MLEAGAARTRAEPRRSGRGRTWRRLMQQPVAVGAGVVLVVLFLAGELAPRFAPNPQTVHLADRWRNHPRC